MNKNHEPQENTLSAIWGAPTRRAAAISLGIFAVFILYIARPVLPFVIVAALMAFILAPVIGFFQNRLRFPKWLAILLAYLILVITLLTLPLILVPSLVAAFNDFNFDLVQVVGDTREWLIITLSTYEQIILLGVPLDLTPIITPALDVLRNVSPDLLVPSLSDVIAFIPTTIQFTVDFATSVFGTLASAFLAVALTFLYSFYMSADTGKMERTFHRFIPPAYKDEFQTLTYKLRVVWNSYLRGQLTLGVIIWLVTWAGGWIIGLPGAFALGVIAGVLEVLPNLGPILAAIPALIVAILQGSNRFEVSNFVFLLIVLGMYALIQQLENNVIAPKILGDAVELSPLTIMVSIVVGFSVAGILGALLAAPVVASGKVIVFYVYDKILMQDPFPPEEQKLARKSKGLPMVTPAKKLWRSLQMQLQKRNNKS